MLISSFYIYRTTATCSKYGFGNTEEPCRVGFSEQAKTAPPSWGFLTRLRTMGRLATFLDVATARIAFVLVLAFAGIVVLDTWRLFVTGYGYVEVTSPPRKFK